MSCSEQNLPAFAQSWKFKHALKEAQRKNRIPLQESTINQKILHDYTFLDICVAKNGIAAYHRNERCE
ncbi:MAG: hypothetical protein GY705_11640 [Bacteroidetes bacterium]|nr:hypothetical protein [Bacteroidota bacterium]